MKNNTFIIKNYVDITDKLVYSNNILHNYIYDGDFNITKILLNKYNINTIDENNNTPLITAIKFKKNDIIRLIISMCPNIYITDVELKNPLHLSVIYDLDIDIIESLLIFQINVNSQDIFGNTALHYSMLLTYNVVKLLLNYGAHPLIPNNQGKNCIYYSVKSKQIRLLLEETIKLRCKYNNCINELMFSPYKFM